MNKDELEGSARYVGGKVEKAVGDVADSREWTVDGVVDQVAGSAQHTMGRAKSVAADAIDSAPALAGEARDRLKAAGEQAINSARDGSKAAVQTVQDQPVIWALAAAALAYGLAWLIHGRRD